MTREVTIPDSNYSRVLDGVALVMGACAVGWGVLGAVLWLGGNELSWYWVPVRVLGVAGAAVAAAIWFTMHHSPSHGWRVRGRELLRVFSWRDPFSWRLWLFWLLASCAGVYAGVASVVFGQPEDRLVGAVIVVVSSSVAWIGVKALDVRIDWRERHRRSPES